MENNQNKPYLQTYTAGEDNGRLASVAKELGLLKSRQQRPQIREESTIKRKSLIIRSPRRQSTLVHIPKRRHSHHHSIDNDDNHSNDNHNNRRHSVANVWKSLLQTTTEDARMLAVYSAHDELEDFESFTENDLDLYESGGPILETAAHSSYQVDSARYEETTQRTSNTTDHPEIDSGSGDLTSAVLGIIKGMVGPAILYLPHGFANAGYLVALPLLILCTFFFLYSSSCLLESWKQEHDRYITRKTTNSHEKCDDQKESREQSPLLGLYDNNNLLDPAVISYQITTESNEAADEHYDDDIMLSYPELTYRALGTVGESIVKIGIACMQSGVCLTYLIFVPKNLHSSVLYLFKTNIESRYWLIVMIVVQIPLSFIHDIRKLTPTNLLANLCILYGLCICVGHSIIQCMTTQTSSSTTLQATDDVHSLNIPSADTNEEFGLKNSSVLIHVWSHLKSLTPYAPNWILFIGTSVFLFEGSITLLVPLQESVVVVIDDESDNEDSSQDQLLKQQEILFPKVYTITILCIIMFYTFFGFICWMAYGDDVNVVLTTSLPANGLTTSVQLAYSIAVIFTFPLQNFPASEIIAKSSLSWISRNKSNAMLRVLGCHYMTERTQRNIISTCIVILLATLAVFMMDSLDKLVSLMGSLFGCPIAFIIPPIIHNRLVVQKQILNETSTNNERNTGGIANVRWRQLMNYVAIVFGVVAMVIASSITIAKWH